MIALVPAVEANAPMRQTIHANALLIGSAGLLLRGSSGAGKSGLCRELVALAESRGLFARLIGDDRVTIANRNGRLVARPHPAIAGVIEERGVGIVSMAFEPAGVIRCVIDLCRADEPAPDRCPEPETMETSLCGVMLPRLVARASEQGAARRIFSFIHDLVAF
jgi:serine kinase of HPr protein (carbohydrate metabolism regulator)